MNKLLLIPAFIITLACTFSPKREAGAACHREITVVENRSGEFHYIKVPCIANEGWDTTAEVKFWQRVITMTPDSSVACLYNSRKILVTLPTSLVDSFQKLKQLDSLREIIGNRFGIPKGTRILFTSGKNHFYNFDPIKPKLKRAIEVFDSMGIDPFYAQSVLLIESPGTNRQKSVAGAYGHFQLMPYVARSYGLVVNKYHDDREDFTKSAVAASKLFRGACIPYARKWCETYGFEVNEEALWFKLLALHIYNAGAGTVKPAVAAVPVNQQGNKLIQTLWHTKAGYFANEAQNYSQLALACYLEFEKQMGACKLIKSSVYK